MDADFSQIKDELNAKAEKEREGSHGRSRSRSRSRLFFFHLLNQDFSIEKLLNPGAGEEAGVGAGVGVGVGVEEEAEWIRWVRPG